MADFRLVVDAGPGRRAEWLDQVTGELADDLREIGGIAVRQPAAPAAGGTKSGVVGQLGELAVSGGAVGVTAWALRDVLCRFLDRTRATSVTVRNGEREVTIERPTDRQVDQLLDRLRDVLGDG